MNKLKLDNTGGLPFDQNILDFMQNAYHSLQQLGHLAGNLTILSGCQTVGNSVTDGYVFIEGEVLRFQGGANSGRVIIKEEARTLPFEDGQNKPVEITRYATFGNGTPFYNWADFQRITPITKKVENFDFQKLAQKVSQLKNRLSKTIPIGLVAIWDRPAAQIPEGWVEHTEMRGRVPAGQGSGKFSTLGAEIGEAEHRLTIAEMPRHSHKFKGRITQDDKGSGGDGYEYSTQSYFGINEGQAIDYQGESRAHNNIQPTRIVKYIRFVGFN